MASATIMNKHSKEILEENKEIEKINKALLDIKNKLNSENKLIISSNETNNGDNNKKENFQKEEEESEFKKFKENKNNNFLVNVYWIVTYIFALLECFGLLFWIVFPRGPIFPGPISGPPKPRVIPTWKDYAEEAFMFFPLNIIGIFSFLADIKILYSSYVYLNIIYTAFYCFLVFYVLLYDGVSGAAVVMMFLIVKYVCISTSLKIKNLYFKA